jgi:hypothetical protein
MQSTGAAMPVVEAQSKLAAAYFAGQYALPSKARIERAITAAYDSAVERWGSKRPMMRIDFDAFIADSANELKRGAARIRIGTKGFTGTPRSAKSRACAA